MAVGVIAEYNPFHNGHLLHLSEIKKLFPGQEIILVLSGNFTQRGEVSIINKFKKCEIAIKAGVDLVVELPFVFATQSADFFSYGAVTILEKLHVDYLIFGSEANCIDDLIAIAKCQINNPEFDKLVKIYSKLGENFPTALSKAVYDLTKKNIKAPNDLLGISYVKTILQNNYKIKPICIKRIDNYHSDEISEVCSATAIRKALKQNINVSKAVPNFVLPYLENLHYLNDYFPLLKYKIITDEDLESYQGVDEGMDKKLKQVIKQSNNYEELIMKIKSKRYTYNRISRMLLHILVGFTKREASQSKNIEYIRILGFNENGRSYLNKYKKKIDVKILSKFIKDFSSILDFEVKTTQIYCLYKENNIVDEEFKNHLGKKEFM